MPKKIRLYLCNFREKPKAEDFEQRAILRVSGHPKSSRLRICVFTTCGVGDWQGLFI